MTRKQYQQYDSGINASVSVGRKFVNTLRWIVSGALKLGLVVLFTLFLYLLVFRWVDIPTSAYISKQNQLALNAPKIYEKALYEWVDWEDISPQLAIAVIASEDQRFPNHWGVDTIELKKALAEKRSAKGNPRGASTITQQLAKNLFLWNGRSYTRKVIEAGLALSIEIMWPKKRILEVYLNVAQFGGAIYGAKEASRVFFDIDGKNLSREEAALLAAVLPRPAVSNTTNPSPELLKRQQWILKQMKQLGGVNYLKKLN